jgi:succinate dehydrogenase / fumarate reductase iron-sulfur subunit
MKFQILRFDPDVDQKPYFKEYDIALEPSDRMLLDALIRIKSIVKVCAVRTP